MKKFVIERDIPGLGELSREELINISKKSCEVVTNLEKPYHWVCSFVTNEKMYCIHIAEDEETVREHARKGGFPVDKVSEVKTTLDPAVRDFLLT